MAARKLVAIAEVFRRNPEDGFEPEPGQMPQVVHEFTRDQLAFALGESRAAADWLLTVAWHLATRLAATLEALRDGIITRGKAELIVRLTQYLSDDEARAVEAKILGRAGRLTPGGLRSALARAVMEVAPETAQAAAPDGGEDRPGGAVGRGLRQRRPDGPRTTPRRGARVRPADQQPGRTSCARPGWRAAWTSCAPGRSWTWSSAKTPAPRRQATNAAAAAAAAPASGAGPAGGPADGFAGRVTLTVPLATLLGLDQPARRAVRAGPGRPVAGPRPGRRGRAESEDDVVRDRHRPARPRRRPRLRPARTREPAGYEPGRQAAIRPGTAPGSPSLPAGKDGPAGGYGTWRLRVPGGGPALVAVSIR